MSAGHRYSCALRRDSDAVCWGIEFGTGAVQDGPFKAVTAEGGWPCGLSLQGKVIGWGGSFSVRGSEIEGEFEAIAGGSSRMCGIRTDMTVGCWGET